MERKGQSGAGWTARVLVALALILVGAAAAAWALAEYPSAARMLGVVPVSPTPRPPSPEQQPPAAASSQSGGTLNPAIIAQIQQLQERIRRVESESEEAQGSTSRADALLIAFAARRAIERGVALGYLEPLLVERFGAEHPQAVATIVTASRNPVRLTQLIARFQDLEPQLLGPPPDEGVWTGIKRGFGSLITVRRADRPSNQPQARYDRARAHLTAGEVDAALAEAMRLPGAPRARQWVASARQYVAVQRALDRIESTALMGTRPRLEPD